MDHPNASPLSSEQTEMASDLAARLVERLRLQGQGKKAEAVPLPPLPTAEQEAIAKGETYPPLLSAAPETETPTQGPSSHKASSEAEREGDNLSSSLPSPQATALSQEMVERAMAEQAGKGSEGKRVDPTPERQRLPLPVRRRIVELFATFHSLTAVVAMIDDEFGLSLDRRRVADFDLDSPRARLGKSLRTYGEAIRQDHITNVSKVAIAHQGQRLRLIGKLVEKAEKSKDFNAALKGLELAAKEMGGVLDASVAKKVEHSGMVAHAHLNVEDARQEVAMRLRQMVEAAPAPSLPAPAPQGIEDGEFSAIPEEDTGQGQ